jgi:UrcA family protein
MSRLPFVFGVALMTAAPLFVAAARAEETPVRVSTRGVDFADPAAVKAFYQRVRSAARTACSSDLLVPWASREDEACRRRFVKDAVNQVDEPLLTRLDDRASGKTSSAYVNDDR